MAMADHEAAGDYTSGAKLLAWDCGSALYDSYELAVFTRQLDAAVLACGRSLSMPHLAAATTPPLAGVQLQGAGRRRKRRLPALLRRLFSKVLRLRLSPGPARGAPYRTRDEDGAGSPWSGALTSIPEEQSSSSPEMGSSSPVEPGRSALRKTQSERFVGSKTASSIVQFEVVL